MEYSDPHLRVNRATRYWCSPDWSWDTGFGRMSDFDLWTVEDGRGNMKTPDGEVPLRPGVSILLRPGERYVGTHDPEQPLVVTAIHFDFLDSAGAPVVAEQVQDPPAPLAFFTDMGFATALHNRVLASWNETASDDARRICSCWLAALLLERRRCGTPQATAEQASRRAEVEHLCARIVRNPAADIRVADMAREMGCRREHLCRLFRQVKGVGPKEFILASRLNLAMELLRDSSLPIKRVAALAGFGYVSYFMRQFKARTGASPAVFRRTPVRAARADCTRNEAGLD
jgi:AraC-like DNA-binding protein